MTIQQLIDELKRIPDKSLPVFFYNSFTDDIQSIDKIDPCLTDRLDLMTESEA